MADVIIQKLDNKVLTEITAGSKASTVAPPALAGGTSLLGVIIGGTISFISAVSKDYENTKNVNIRHALEAALKGGMAGGVFGALIGLVAGVPFVMYDHKNL